MKIRRYFRGSGRVLAFVFIASVVWLLFDMAALRISINDANGQLLKERVMKERELVVQERELVRHHLATRETLHRAFKHPVQRVDLDYAGKGPLVDADNKVAEVYRHHRARNQNQKGPVLPEAPKHNKDTEPGVVHKQDVHLKGPADKKAVDLSDTKPGGQKDVVVKSDTKVDVKTAVEQNETKVKKDTVKSKKVEAVKDVAKSDTKEAVKSDAKEAVKSDKKEAVKSDTKVEIKDAVKSDTKVEIKDAVKSDTKVEIKEAAKSNAKLEAVKDVAKSDIKYVVKSDTKVEIKDAVKSDTKVEIKDAVKSETKVGINSDTKAEVEKAGVLSPNKVVSSIVKVPAGVPEGKPVPPPTAGKTLQGVADAKQIGNTDSKGKEKVKDEPKPGAGSLKSNNTVKASAKPAPKNLKGGEADAVDQGKRAETLAKNDLSALKEPPKATTGPALQRGANVNSGVHKVLSLDMTQAPRDAKAVGQFGQAAMVPNGKEDESRKRWDEGHFNVYLSERIPVDRAIPDTRPQTCSQSLVHDALPTTSVIFCFVDEVWSTLLRSVHSVINRSPPHLLKEIILVDDFSTKDHLKQPLDDYMAQFPKVRIVRLKERQGLIRARLAGAAIAQGEVLTFLDSHVECNVGWLEPLLERVYLDRRKVACPVIEVISDKDMGYVLVDNFQRGIFKWPLVFGWSTLTADHIKKNNMSVSDPIRCPVMAGGLFSIDKKYFYELGAYDPGLDVWGGENMEISFKIWMCGGEIEIIPCSRVGHIFRGQNPYKFPKDRQKTVERNLARVAEVWLDDYKDLFYGHGYHHLLDKNVDIGDLTEQTQLRKTLGCKSFKWYLENVYPDMDAPLAKAQGLVFNRGLRKCLALQKGSLSFEICNLSKQSQLFDYTWLRHVRQGGLCVVPQGAGVGLEPCDRTRAAFRWLHKASDSALAEHIRAEGVPGRRCLEAVLPEAAVRLGECDVNNAQQKWQFTHYYG